MTKQNVKKPKVITQMLCEGETYAFSLNPEYQAEKFATVTRDRMIVNHVKNQLHKLHGCTYAMYPEFAPLTGRLHYHGYLKITKVYDFYLTLPKVRKLCQIEIDIINDKQIWEEYIFKDRKKMELPMKNKQIPYQLTDKTRWRFGDAPPEKPKITDFINSDTESEE